MAKCRLWVYNAEIFFVASGHPFAPVIRRTKRNSKKVFFWDTLLLVSDSVFVKTDCRNESHVWVYNAEIFFVTSYNPMAWVVKRQKLNFKKVFFWNTLMYNVQ